MMSEQVNGLRRKASTRSAYGPTGDITTTMTRSPMDIGEPGDFWGDLKKFEQRPPSVQAQALRPTPPPMPSVPGDESTDRMQALRNRDEILQMQARQNGPRLRPMRGGVGITIGAGSRGVDMDPRGMNAYERAAYLPKESHIVNMGEKEAEGKAAKEKAELDRFYASQTANGGGQMRS